MKPVEDIPKSHEGWFFPNNSMLLPLFDNLWSYIHETGSIDRAIVKYAGAPPNCPSKGVVDVNFEFVLILFVILLVGVGLAIFSFFFELKGFNLTKYIKVWP